MNIQLLRIIVRACSKFILFIANASNYELKHIENMNIKQENLSFEKLPEIWK